MPGAPQPGHARGVGPVRGLEVAAGPERQSRQARRPGPGQVVIRHREVDRAPGVPHRARDVAPGQGQAGPVHLDLPGRRAKACRSTTTISAPQPLARSPSPGGVSSHRSASRSRPSTPSNSLIAISAPTNPTLSTGRTRTSSSGISSSHPRTVASCRLRLSARDGQLDQVRCALKVSGGQGVADGHGLLTVLLVPLAGPPVQARHLTGLLVEQPRLQHVGEQVVVAVPLAAVVERDQEQVAPVQRLQDRLAAGAPGDGIAQRTAQPVQDRGLQQEGPDISRTGAAAPPRPGSRRCSGRPRRSRR